MQAVEETKQNTVDSTQLWNDATILWNSIKIGEEVSIDQFIKDLSGDEFPKETRKSAHSFLRYMCKYDRAKKKDGENDKFIKLIDYIKKYQRDGTIIANVVKFLNDMPIDSSFTLGEFRKVYKEKYKKEIAISTANLYLVNASNSGFLIRTLIKKTVHYNKILQIPKSKTNLITTKFKKRKQENTSPLKLVSNRGEIILSESLSDRVEKILDEKECDLYKEFRRGFVLEIAESLNVPHKEVQHVVAAIRRKKNIKVQMDINSIHPGVLGIYNSCLEGKLFRGSNKEGVACDIIQYTLIKRLPFGGASMLIGTSSPYFVSTNPKNNKIITDNLAVATVLQATSVHNPLTIIIGTGVNLEKAKLKKVHWKYTSSINKPIIKLDIVDTISFTRYITSFAEKHNPAKVVLLTSGTWIRCNATYKKYGFDTNFESASKYLTSGSGFKNLHIIALTREPTSHHGYCVRYLHNGKNEVIEIPKENPDEM